MDDSFSIEEVLDPESASLVAAVELLEAGFPEGEKESQGAMQQWVSWARDGSLVPDNYHVMVARLASSGTVVGAVFFHYIDSIASGFVGYLIVKEGLRGAGIGAALLAGVREQIERDAWNSGGRHAWGIFTELDKKREAEADPYRHLRFWSAHNTLPLDMTWRYPPLGRDPPADMHLAFCPLTGSDTLSEEQACDVVRAIYACVYGRVEGKADLAAVLSDLQGRRRVGRLPVPP